MKGYSYTMKAIPTVFGGVEYRSRLEARWGAFFTLLGWDHLYEPLDLDGWAPDFMIRGAAGVTLIEVKPEINVDTMRAFRMAAPPSSRSILVGAAPTITEWQTTIGVGWGDGVVGYMSHEDDPEPTSVGHLEDILVGRCGGGAGGCGLGMCPADGAWSCWRCNAYDGNPAWDDGVIDGLWKRACNLTKWGR